MSGSEFLNLSLDEIIAKEKVGRARPRSFRPNPRQGSGPRRLPPRGRGGRSGAQPRQQVQMQQQPQPKQYQPQQPRYVPITVPIKGNLAVKAGGVQKRPNQPRYVPANLDAKPMRHVQNNTNDNVWRNDKFETQRGGSQAGRKYVPVSSGHKIYITNLYHAVTSKDILELFSSMGTVLNHRVNIDASGRCLGNAEVTFSTAAAAEKARKEYNGVTLDGQEMSISLHPVDSFVQKLSSGIRVERPIAQSRANATRPFISSAGRNRIRSIIRP
mmetsp:Transcript_30397/g.55536  ORF Transcript_30397/g.55536 Transcript_30397/m.55536 type:complete len:271 (-) Transcript_30397:679-1491(-)|eukprot:CAMPEP_0175052502 /NCGR_PEP_ID=MMETSP0052_2-20121109/8394_1 /TAXON_ID=51329 ORGANISM="Polytomella parva, Strain SAG 63-3" /NCGR_SAMPLE_ID=MMETSP0052_2 /ASSEMBLY_ACC=CAM_ASM_000194 /LENGTH=270 /DNA_ID=CAMNT_0016316911 /DNA_START=84 /DNA_END=896 /DNA_ORIENTATION=-